MNLGPLVDRIFKDAKPDDTVKIVAYLDKACKDLIEPFIHKEYEALAEYMNAYEQKMLMKREVIADKGIWTAKKRYILNVHNSEGVSYKDPKLKIMGIETTRSSTPQVVRDSLKKAIKLILTTDEATLIRYIADERERFRTLSPEEIAFPRTANGLATYSDPGTIYRKGTPIHVKGSLIYNHMIQTHKLTNKYEAINEGGKIKFLSLKVPNPTHDKVIAFIHKLPPEFGLHKYVNYDEQFDRAFLDPLASIMEIIGWNHEQRASLESLFA